MEKIDDPALGDAGACVKARLVLAIEPIRRLGDLHDQRCSGWMRVDVRARIVGHNGDVRFGLRIVVERDGKLRVDLPGLAQRITERFQHAPNRGRVPTPLWFTDGEEPI